MTNERLRYESEYLARVHEEAISNFEKKFGCIQREVETLTRENEELREADSKNRRRINELDLDNLEWRDRTKHAGNLAKPAFVAR